MKHTIWILLLLTLHGPLTAQQFTAADSLHLPFNDLLQQYVTSEGQVRYDGLQREHTRLQAYLQQLSKLVPEASTPREASMAYWINAYNAFTLDLIVRNYPIKSILQLDNGKTWDVKRISLGGKKYSLNQIEHEILRKKWADPRIHFALNCAAKSCPPLFHQAYLPSQLEQQLEARTIYFINHSGYNQLSGQPLRLSKIFEWYAADFGDLHTFLRKYYPKELKTRKISYNEYNWDLNR